MKRIMAKIKLEKAVRPLLDTDLAFLKNYSDNFSFFVYSTFTGNRNSIQAYYIPDEFKEIKANPSGYEIPLGEVHIKLVYKNKTNIKMKLDKLLKGANNAEKEAREMGYPYKAEWNNHLARKELGR